MKKAMVGIAAVLTLGTGGTFAADAQLNTLDDKGDRLEKVLVNDVEDAGVSKMEMVKDEPKIVLSKWDGEVSMGVSYNKIDGKGERAFLTSRTEWKDSKGKEELHAFPVDDSTYEIEVILNEKPATNVFDFTIEGAQDLDFFFQPALTPEEIADGAERPDNVVGSYAVYHKTKANHQVGSTNYATGKAYHIYRPKAIDANGAETWAELSYIEGTLSVTVPQKFLDDAVYPVRVDPTFGYTTIGGTSAARTANRFLGVAGTGVTGAVTSISWYAATDDDSFKGAIVASTTKIIMGLSPATAAATGPDWSTSTFLTSPYVTAQAYFVAVIHDNANATYYFDTGVTGDQLTDTSNNYAVPTDPTDGTTTGNLLYSIYATYDSTCTTNCVLGFMATETWTAPTGVTSADVACWGGGGGGDVVAASAGGGGGGGAFASSTVAVTPSSNYTVTVGAGGAGGTSPGAGTDSNFVGNDKTVNADGGTQAVNEANGTGGTVAGSTGDVENDGGNGGDGVTTDDAGGGGGGAGGPAGDGGAGSDASATVGGGGGGANGGGAGGQPDAGTAGSNAGAGGTGDSNGSTSPGGGQGGSAGYGGGGGGGGDNGDPSGDGGYPGGGGGGGEITGLLQEGGDARGGQCTITYTVVAAANNPKVLIQSKTIIQSRVIIP